MMESQLSELKVKLKASETAQVNFMASGDKLASEKKVLIDGISHDLFESLKPLITKHIGAINPAKTCCTEVNSHLKELKECVERQGVNVVRSQSTIESTSDNVDLVISALDCVGIRPSQDFDLPASVSQVLQHFSSIDGHSKSDPDVFLPNLHDGPCNFQYVQDKPGILACILGCQKTHDVNSLQTNATNSNNNISNEAPHLPQNNLPSNRHQPNSNYVSSSQGQSGLMVLDSPNEQKNQKV